jgi:signal transduction histidine kinase
MILAIPQTRRTLTLTYLAIIMTVSLAFSIALYEVSSRTISTGLASQEHAYYANGALLRPSPNSLQLIRDAEYGRVQRNLLGRLLLLNLAMLALGAWFSSWLAVLSLRPLEEALESQARFTSDAAHELRTPLTAMKTEIEVALRDTSLKAANAKALLASNLEEVNKLDVLTAALLRLAKTEASAQTTQQIVLKKILDKAAERAVVLAEPKHITFAIAPTKATTHGDPHQLTELIYILLENAIKYSQDGTTVTVKTAGQNDTVKIAIADQGIGIKSHELPHIFERFYRADQSRTNSPTSGYGLGLSLAKHIAEAHGGTITATSKPNHGSTFTVILPTTS